MEKQGQLPCDAGSEREGEMSSPFFVFRWSEIESSPAVLCRGSTVEAAVV